MQSVGTARTDVEVRVVDDADVDVPVGEVGEIVVRGDVVMAGYLDRPEATAEAAEAARMRLRGPNVGAGEMEAPSGIEPECADLQSAA